MRRRDFIIWLPLLALTATGCPRRTTPPPTGGIVPFQQVVAAQPADYGNYLFKLTYMGPQSKPMKTLVFGSAATRSPAPFAPFRRQGYRYDNDDGEFVELAASATEIEKIMQALAGDRTLTDSQNRPSPTLSFMIMRKPGTADQKVFETLVEFPDAARLVRDIIGANLDPGNSQGATLIRYWTKNVSG